jgi:hypothetical protein
LPSFESFVSSNLGDAGTSLLTFMEVREQLIERGQDWRNLSTAFIIEDGTQGAGNILNTHWSQLGEGVYARFITEGNAGDTGFLLMRIEDLQSASAKETQVEQSNQTKVLPLILLALTALTVYDFYDLISTLMALPEGDQSIQPLAMSPDLQALAEVALELCDNVRGRGRLTLAISMVCNAGDRAPRTARAGSRRPNTDSANPTPGRTHPGDNQTPASTTNGVAVQRNFTEISNAGGGGQRVRRTTDQGSDFQFNTGHAYREHRSGPDSHPQRAGTEDQVENAIVDHIQQLRSADGQIPDLTGAPGTRPLVEQVSVNGVTIEYSVGVTNGVIRISDYWALP